MAQLIGAFCVGMLLVGCAAGQPAGDRSPDEQPVRASGSSVTVAEVEAGPVEHSRVRTYSSLREMAAASSVVGVFEATGETSHVNVGGDKVLVVTVRQVEGIAGEEAGTARVATFASEPSGDPVLSAPGRFLLFLKPWVTGKGRMGDAWLVTDDWSGIYVEGQREGQWVRHDTQATQLPESVLSDDLGELPTRSTADLVAEAMDAGQRQGP